MSAFWKDLRSIFGIKKPVKFECALSLYKRALAWIIHDSCSQKEKDALKG